MKHKSLLGQYEARLSDVKRWGIVRTIQKQSVAEHSFRVALIATRLATRYFAIEDNDYTTLYKIMRMAILHDQLEGFTGDIPSPSKFAYNGDVAEDKYKDKVQEPCINDDKLKGIVKAADYLESVVFLFNEISMGNISINTIMRKIIDSAYSHMINLGLAPAQIEAIFDNIGEHMEQQDPLS